jgi:hypothetical protein
VAGHPVPAPGRPREAARTRQWLFGAKVRRTSRSGGPGGSKALRTISTIAPARPPGPASAAPQSAVGRGSSDEAPDRPQSSAVRTSRPHPTSSAVEPATASGQDSRRTTDHRPVPMAVPDAWRFPCDRRWEHRCGYMAADGPSPPSDNRWATGSDSTSSPIARSRSTAPASARTCSYRSPRASRSSVSNWRCSSTSVRHI